MSKTTASAAPDPYKRFATWYRKAERLDIPLYNTMTLATVGPNQRPSARMVLLKEFDERGFTFYTNYESRKGQELEKNPHVALVFWWQPLNRQIRIEGKVNKVSEEESDAYFVTRPRGYRIGAWASDQSRQVTGSKALVKAFLKFTAKFKTRPVPRPPSWGGCRVSPSRIEFWTQRANRLHERIEYCREKNGGWTMQFLAP
jgi:pyridoxamine 5'-phosphate oxidase